MGPALFGGKGIPFVFATGYDAQTLARAGDVRYALVAPSRI
jgi:hypothetical protein